MSSHIPKTGTPMSRRTAGAIVLGSVVLLLLSVRAASDIPPLKAPAPDTNGRSEQPEKSDTRFYRDVVAKVRTGQPYYEAVRDEFALPIWSPRGFKPTSVFNWRLPTYAWLLAALPNPAGKVLITILASAGALLAFMMARAAGPAAGSLTVLLVGPLAWCLVGEVFYFSELWAGILILISICCFGIGRSKLGVAAGIAALLFRELSAVYCVIMLCIAILRRRRGEAAAWLTGFSVFAVLFAYHIRMVSEHMPATSSAFSISAWLRFSGLPFLLRSTQVTNVFLVLLPAWVAAVWLTAAFTGVAGRQDDIGRATFATVLAYTSMISVLGAPGTYYWGLMVAPLLSVGVALLPSTLRQVRSAFARYDPSTGDSTGAPEGGVPERL